MGSLMTEELGISHRQLQILAIFWEAGEPLHRLDLLKRFHERFGAPIEDASLRSHLRKLDERDMLTRERAEREPGSLGRTPTLYSAKPKPAEILSNLLDTVFGDIFDHDPTLIDIALRHLERLKRVHRGANSVHGEVKHRNRENP